MTFRVNGIKQENTGSSPVELLVITDSSLLVRKLLEKNNILLLSLKEYRQDIRTFGDVFAKVKRGLDEISLVSNLPDVKAACLFFLRCGFDILGINSYSKTLPENEIQTIIKTARETIQKERLEEQKLVQKQEAIEQKTYSDPRLADAKSVVIWIFDRATTVLERTKSTLASKELKAINELQEDLKKLRMGNNYEKIRDTGAQLLTKIQQLDEDSFVGKTGTLLIPGSVVTDQDIIKQETIQEYVLQFKKLGAPISLKNEDYAILGNSALFRKFFQKDIMDFFAHPTNILFRLYALAEHCIGGILILAGGFISLNILFGWMENVAGVYYRMMKFGCLGLILRIGNHLKRPDIIKLIFLYGGTILAYRLLTYMLIINFAL